MFNKKNLTCTGGVGVAHDEEAIIINFRGTVGGAELAEEEGNKYPNIKISSLSQV